MGLANYMSCVKILIKEIKSGRQNFSNYKELKRIQFSIQLVFINYRLENFKSLASKFIISSRQIHDIIMYLKENKEKSLLLYELVATIYNLQ